MQSPFGAINRQTKQLFHIYTIPNLCYLAGEAVKLWYTTTLSLLSDTAF